MSQSSAISVQPHAEVVCVVVERERLDDPTVDELQRDAVAAADQQPKLPVVLDMAKVNYVPSLGLGTLVMLGRTFRNRGQRLLLVGLQPDVRTVLAITRLDKLFEIHPNLDAALAQLQRDD